MASKCGAHGPTSPNLEYIEVEYKIILEDFKKRLHSYWFFDIKSPKRYNTSFGVGMDRTVDLGIEIVPCGKNYVVIELLNKSAFRICLSGNIELQENGHSVNFEATKMCSFQRNSNWCLCGIGIAKKDCKIKINLFRRLYFDEAFKQENATVIFKLKFFPLNSPKIRVLNETKLKIKLAGESALKRDMAAMRKQDKSADLSIVCNEKCFRAHKLILSARSTVFDTMFSQTGFKENDTNTVAIDDCDEDTMEMFLSYLYEGVLYETTFEAAEALINLAIKYDVQPLREACTEILAAHLEEGNAIGLVILSSLYQLTDLKRKALDTIVAARRPLKTMNGWEDLEKIQDLKIEIIDYKASK